MLLSEVTNLGGNYTPDHDPVVAKIVTVNKPKSDMNGIPIKNKGGFMEQILLVTDASGTRELLNSTKFDNSFMPLNAEGMTHRFRVKDYKGKLQGYSLEPKVGDGAPNFSPPTPEQKTAYKQAAEINGYDDPTTKAIHRQCAMKAAIEIIDPNTPRTGDVLKTELVEWANFFVHYYRTGNANQPDASITGTTKEEMEQGDPFGA